MATNMKENGFETMIVKYLVENNHYEEGSNSDYNKIYAIDEVRLFRFLHDTQYNQVISVQLINRYLCGRGISGHEMPILSQPVFDKL